MVRGKTGGTGSVTAGAWRARASTCPESVGTHDGEPVTANDPSGRASSPAERFGVRGSPGSLQPEQGTAGHAYGCTSPAD
ncbi:hypothetical protein ABZW44_43145 [Streptomyces mirabilis]|uniref:hypothetical protein n=1 Tax=Streptomyces mirabilis TaxID=68239 RepID=UPI0033B7F302